jgi:predicted dehydrogenase
MRHDAMTKVGMLGAGYILGSHAASVRANPALSLHAVADASQGRARAAQTTHGFAHALGSIDAMAASDCDAVHVLLPPALHGDAAAAMLKAGKSVFVEKPFVIDKATADGLCEQARQVGARSRNCGRTGNYD